MRLLLDHHISPKVARALSDEGFDVVTTRALGLERDEDEPLWEIARRLGRVVVTYNVGDFVQIYRQWFEKGIEHPGLIVVSPWTIAANDIGGQIRALRRQLGSGEDCANRLIYLERVEV